jgi:dUTP pyrophosphatase
MQTEETLELISLEKRLVPLKVIAASNELLPVYASAGAAGADLKAHLESDLILKSGSFALVATGLKFEIPQGFEVQIRPRSGLALKYGVTVLNTPGTIDSDYRGEVKVILINHGKEDFVVTPLMRIAQLVIAPVYIANFIEANDLASSNRGAGGFGHTGTH